MDVYAEVERARGWRQLYHAAVQPLSTLVDREGNQIVAVTEALITYARNHLDVWDELLAGGWVPEV